MREQLFAKLAELRELLEQATCDGVALDLDSFEDEVGMDIGAALNTLEQCVQYYVD
jgi:hypothetical protein